MTLAEWLDPLPPISTLMVSAFWMTWLFVSTSPELDTISPVPAPSPPPSRVVVMLTSPGVTSPATPALVWSLGELTDDAPDGDALLASLGAALVAPSENSDPPRVELPSSAPPAR